MSDDEQIAALQEEIRRAGRITRRARLWVAGIALAPFIAVGILPSLWFLACFVASLQLMYLAVVVVYAAGSCVVAAAVALPSAALYRGVRRKRLGRRLAAVAPTECAGVLRQLARDSLGDTRKIVSSLARSLGLSTEIAVGSAPGSTAGEARPAEVAP
jgi:hypothetical protein